MIISYFNKTLVIDLFNKVYKIPHNENEEKEVISYYFSIKNIFNITFS